MQTVKCGSCGWVHFEVSRQYAEDEVKTFNEFYETLDKEEKLMYYGNEGAKISNYESCDRCGASYKNFYEGNNDFLLSGHTIGPIIKRGE